MVPPRFRAVLAAAATVAFPAGVSLLEPIHKITCSASAGPPRPAPAKCPVAVGEPRGAAESQQTVRSAEPSTAAHGIATPNQLKSDSTISPGSNPGHLGNGPREAAGESKCCLGVLYFNQAMHESRRGPSCMGVRTKPSQGQEDLKNPATGLVDFKYICAGYSVYSKPAAGKDGKPKDMQDDIVQLPYCEGLEVISSREVQGEPALLNSPEAAAGDVRHSNAQASGKSSPPPPNRNFVPGATDVNLDEFPARVWKTAKKILAKMASNLKLLASSVYKAFATLFGGRPNED